MMISRAKFSVGMIINLSLTSAVIFALGVSGLTDTAKAQSDSPEPIIVYPNRTDTTKPLRDLPPLPPQPQNREITRKLLPNRAGDSGSNNAATGVQESAPTGSDPKNSTNIEGIRN